MIVSQHPVGPVLPDHAVELPARDGDPQDRARARRGLHRRHQAGRAHAADHAATSRSCSRTPACPTGVVNVFTTSTSGDGVGADHRATRGCASSRSPARPQVGRRLLAAGRAGRAAHVDGARRQRAVRRLRRRRPRQGGRRRDAREVPQHRPGLHRGEPVHRAPSRSPTSSPAASPSGCRRFKIGPRHRGRRRRSARSSTTARSTRPTSLVDGCRRRAARSVRTGGARDRRARHVLRADRLTDVQPGSDILREEIFGPVLAIVPFDDRGRGRRASPTTPSTASCRTSSPRPRRAASA